MGRIGKLVGEACERDITEHSVYTEAARPGGDFGNSSFMPKIFVKEYYCIEAAVHKKLVKVRTMRLVRERITKVEGSKAGKSNKLNIGALTKRKERLLLTGNRLTCIDDSRITSYLLRVIIIMPSNCVIGNTGY